MKTLLPDRSLLMLGLTLLVLPVAGAAQSEESLLQEVYSLFYPTVWTCGDAEITDHGPGVAYDRVIVDLGLVDLSVETERSFNLCNVPRQLLAFGMKLELTTERSTEAFREALGGTVVELSIEVQDARVVPLGSGDLATRWHWSCCGPPANRARTGGNQSGRSASGHGWWLDGGSGISFRA